jgi:hypothetical protein
VAAPVIVALGAAPPAARARNAEARCAEQDDHDKDCPERNALAAGGDVGGRQPGGAGYVWRDRSHVDGIHRE